MVKQVKREIGSLSLSDFNAIYCTWYSELISLSMSRSLKCGPESSNSQNSPLIICLFTCLVLKLVLDISMSTSLSPNKNHEVLWQG